MLRNPLVLLSVFTLAFFTACNDTPAPAPVPTLEVSPLQISALAGDAATALEAKVSNSNAAVLWTLEGAGTLSSLKGTATKYTPPAELNTASSAKITVVLEGTKLSQLVNIALTPKPKTYVPTVGTTADLTQPIYAGSSKIRFTASLGLLGPTPFKKPVRSFGSSRSGVGQIEWKLTGPGKLDPVEGEFTDYTPPDEVLEKTQITVAAQYEGLISARIFFVAPKPLQPTLSLSPSSGSFIAGAAGTAFTATSLGSTEALAWTLTGPGTLSSTTGKTVTYTPPSSVSKTETATLTVRAGSLSQSATLTITPQPTLTISPSSATLTAGDAGQSFSATLENSSEPINWTLEGVGTLSNTTGKTVVYTPPSSVTKEETVKLTARAGSALNISTIVQLVVKPKPVVVDAQKLVGQLRKAELPAGSAWTGGVVEVGISVPKSLIYPPGLEPIEVGRVLTSENGRFVFLLPSQEQLPFLYEPITQPADPSCKGTVTITPENLKLTNVVAVFVYVNNKLISAAENDTYPSDKIWIRSTFVYHNASGSMKGEYACNRGGIIYKYIYDKVFEKGWSIDFMTQNNADLFTRYTTQPLAPLELGVQGF